MHANVATPAKQTFLNGSSPVKAKKAPFNFS
jgi:hypothetical protein